MSAEPQRPSSSPLPNKHTFKGLQQTIRNVFDMSLSFVIPHSTKNTTSSPVLARSCARRGPSIPDRDHRRQQRKRGSNARGRAQRPWGSCRRRATQRLALRATGRLPGKHGNARRQRRCRLTPARGLDPDGAQLLRGGSFARRSLGLLRSESAREAAGPRLLSHQLAHIRHQPLHSPCRLHGEASSLFYRTEMLSLAGWE